MEELAERGFVVRSAGVAAYDGHPAAPHAVDVVRTIGGSLEGHRSRRIDSRLARGADYIFAMTIDHLDDLLRAVPEVEARVFLLDPSGGDVADPVGCDAETYRRTCRTIEAMLEERLRDPGLSSVLFLENNIRPRHGSERPPDVHRHRALDECRAAVTEQHVRAAGVIARGILVLTEFHAAPGTVEAAARPLEFLRTGGNDRVEKGHARRPRGPAVPLVFAARNRLLGIEQLIAGLQVRHDPGHVGRGAIGEPSRTTARGNAVAVRRAVKRVGGQRLRKSDRLRRTVAQA